jgi:hypothetical protein
MSALTRALVWSSLAVLVGLTNAPTIDYEFAYDDSANILQRVPAWEQGWGEFFETRQWGVGRHFALVSLDLDRREPLDPRPFHLTNIAISILATLVLFELALAMGLSAGGAFAAAALFAVHPAHTDAVVSISGRATSMSALSVMSCLLLHARGYGKGFAGFVAAAILLVLGLASKEDALVLFPLLILYDLTLRSPDDEFPWKAYGAYTIAAAFWFAGIYPNLATVAPVTYSDNPLAHVGPWQRITRAGELLWSYAAITVWPSELLPDRSFAVTRPETSTGPLGLIAWLVAIGSALALRKRAPKAAFAFLWFPAAFAVTSNVIFPMGTIMSERLMYLPSAGLCLLAGAIITWLAGFGRVTGGAVAIVTSLAVFVGGLMYDDRGRVWASDAHYHQVAAWMSPNSTKVHHNLGLLRARNEDFENAARSFERSLAIYPPFSRSAYYLADVYAREGRSVDATRVWERYLFDKPNDAGARSQIVYLYMTIGDPESALPHAQAMVELDPGNADNIKRLVSLEQAVRARSDEASP